MAFFVCPRGTEPQILAVVGKQDACPEPVDGTLALLTSLTKKPRKLNPQRDE